MTLLNHRSNFGTNLGMPTFKCLTLVKIKRSVFEPVLFNLYTSWQHMKSYLYCLHIYDQPRQHIKKQRHYFANKGLSSQSYGFSSSHVWMWELDYKESWAPKNWCFWTVVLEKTLESPLDCKVIQPVHPKGYQSWVFFGRTDAEAETPILCPPHAKSWLIEQAPDSRRDWGQEEKGTREWDGWMVSPTRWTRVWVNPGSWWWIGRPGMLWFMWSQIVGNDWKTELNWVMSLCFISGLPSLWMNDPVVLSEVFCAT